MAIPCCKPQRSVRVSITKQIISVIMFKSVWILVYLYNIYAHCAFKCCACLSSSKFQKNLDTGQDFELSLRGGSWKPVIADTHEIK